MTSKYTIADFNEAICKPVEDQTNHRLTMLDEQDRKIKGLVEALEQIVSDYHYGIGFHGDAVTMKNTAQAALGKYRSEDD